jgi:hypothetical protein
MPIRFIASTKYLVFSLLTVVILGVSTSLQAQDTHNHADLASENTLIFVTIKETEAQRQTLNTIITRLDSNFEGQLNTQPIESAILTAIDLTNLDYYLGRFITIDPAWVGDQLSLVIQPVQAGTKSLYNGDFDIFTILQLADVDLMLENVKPEVTVTQADDVIFIADKVIVIGNTLIYSDSTEIETLLQIIQTQKSLSASDNYQKGLALIGDDYPIFGTFHTEFLDDMVNSTRRYSSSDEISLIGVDLFSPIMFGINYPDDRTVALDVFHHTLTLDVDSDHTINPDFAQNIPDSVHFALQGADAELLLDLAVTTLNQVGTQIEENKVDGYQIFNMGGLFKQSLITLVAGFTGLNLERDVIEEADEDYALIARLMPEIQLAEVAFLAEIDDDDAIDYIFNSLAEAAQIYGVDVTIQERNLHAPSLLRNLLALEFGNIPVHPSLQLSLIHRNDVLVAGSTPLVNHAIGQDGTLAQTDYYQQALERHPSNLIGLLYLNMPTIAADITRFNLNELQIRADELPFLQFILAQIEPIVISTRIQDGTPASRLTVTFAENIPYPFPDADSTNGTSAGE